MSQYLTVTLAAGILSEQIGKTLVSNKLRGYQSSSDCGTSL